MSDSADGDISEADFSELSAGYALNALSPADLAAFDRARAEHPEWEHHLDRDAAAAAALADGALDATPPLRMRSALLSQIARTPQQGSDAPTEDVEDASTPAPETPDARPHIEPAPTTSTIQAIERRNWTRGLLALAASFVVLVALGWGAASFNEVVNRTPVEAALVEIEAAPDARSESAALADGGTATVQWSESVGKTVVTSHGLPAIADDQDFELWFVRGDEPIPAGTFDGAASGPTAALLEGQMEPGDVIAITVEPAGGSPTGTPSSDPIVAIPTA